MVEQLFNDGRPWWREYSAAFKASVLEQTRQSAASVSGVAPQHGLHPSMVHYRPHEQRLQAVPP
ncbi:MAG: transposase [Pseudomonadales bacterium]